MRVSLDDIALAARETVDHSSVAPERATELVADCVWLEACGYPGLKTLLEAVREEPVALPLEVVDDRLDLKNISCVYIGPEVIKLASATRSIKLNQVKHGLYLLPLAVKQEMAIGCPIDLSFTLGGARLHNPYTDKIALAQQHGVQVADFIWQRFVKALSA